jgi:hypothetical protein
VALLVAAFVSITLGSLMLLASRPQRAASAAALDILK